MSSSERNFLLSVRSVDVVVGVGVVAVVVNVLAAGDNVIWLDV